MVNDSFCKTTTKPDSSETIVEYSGKTINIKSDIYNVYNELNNLKYQRVKSYPMQRPILSAAEQNELLYLIKSCADIMKYDANTDINALMRHVLYTHRNFTLLSSIEPSIEKSGDITMCSSDFIDEVLYKAFRLEPEKPPVNMLTSLKYCYNNSYYYYVGGYDTYFATDVKEITDIFTIDKDKLLVIFYNTYTEADNIPIPEYSYAVFSSDKDGFYITELNMGGDLPDLTNFFEKDSNTSESVTTLNQYLPIISALIFLAVIGIVFYFFIIR